MTNEWSSRAFLPAIVKRMALRNEETSVLVIQLRHAREGQLSMLSGDTLSEKRFASFPESRRFQFPDVENQHPRRPKSPREASEYFVSVGIGDEIVENAAAQNRVVPAGRQSQNVANAEIR